MSPIVEPETEQHEERDPKTGRFLPGNTACPEGNRRAEVHGVETAQRRGFAPEIAVLLEAFRSQVLTDLGGAENLSAIQRMYVDHLVNVVGVCEMLGSYLRANGPLTVRGRQRSSVATLLSAVSTYDKLAARLGLERRTKPTGVTTIEDFMRANDTDDDA